jgi:hypothetical protein
MSIRSRLVKSDILSTFNNVNYKVVEAVRYAVGIHPRTRVAGLSRANTFSVDMATGNIYVTPVDDLEVAKGYLTHENGHRSVFPASSAGSLAFIATIKSLIPSAADDEVIAVANIVADTFSDYVLYKMGLGKNLAKRIPDFMSKADPVDLGMTYKLLVYKAIEYAVKREEKTISRETLTNATRWLMKEKGADPVLAWKAEYLAAELIAETESLLGVYTPKDVANFLLNPFRAKSAPALKFLVRIAAEILRENMAMGYTASMFQQAQSGSGSSYQVQIQQPHQAGSNGSSNGADTDRGSSEGVGSEKEGEEGSEGGETGGDLERQGKGREKEGGASGGEGDAEKDDGSKGKGGRKPKEKGEGGEGVDIVPSKIDVTDVHKAITIAARGFGLGTPGVGAVIEQIFSRQVEEAVREFIEKIKITFTQNDYKVYKPSGFQKRRSELWLHPRGEPDEDSILMEPRKLLWRVTYHVPSPRGRLSIAPASVPEKLIVVQDESGSTNAEFHSSNVLSVEAFVSLIVMAGLRYKNGAKEIDVVKFSDGVFHTYNGSDEVKAGVKVIIPHPMSGGGTNIVGAVNYAISQATRNTALVVVTDAVIDDETANIIGETLRSEVDQGRIGFVVFIVVNPLDVPALDILRSHLTGRNSVVAHVKNAEDLFQVAQTLMQHILTVYASASQA